MPWNTVYSIWADLIDPLCDDFRYMDRTALRRFRGDRAKLVTYLAETHDLTQREADDTLTDWVERNAAQLQVQIAA